MDYCVCTWLNIATGSLEAQQLIIQNFQDEKNRDANIVSRDDQQSE